MKTNLMFSYRSVNALATLFLVVAFVLSLGVIPFVRFNTYPEATPERAIPVFGFIVAYEFIVGTILMFKAYHFTGRSKLSTAFLVVIAILTFILTIAFIDAALAYWTQGPAMHVATIFLLCCSLVNILAIILIIRAIFLFPKPD